MTNNWVRRTLAACVMVAMTSVAVQAADDAAWNELLGDQPLNAHWETKGNWTLDQGVATLTPRPGESGWSRWDAYLWSKKQYQDFEVEFDYQVQKGGNSGFYFRVGDRDNPVAKGIEVQIYDSHSRGPDAQPNDHDSGGVIPGVAPQKLNAKPPGEWNHFHIVSQNNKLTIKLNGEVVNEVDLTRKPLADRPQTGYIGFQDHGLPLSLRNIRVREL